MDRTKLVKTGWAKPVIWGVVAMYATQFALISPQVMGWHTKIQGQMISGTDLVSLVSLLVAVGTFFLAKRAFAIRDSKRALATGAEVISPSWGRQAGIVIAFLLVGSAASLAMFFFMAKIMKQILA